MDKYDARGIVGLLRSERQLVAGDMNGQVGKDRAEYEDYALHGCHGIGAVNEEGIKVLDMQRHISSGY